MKLFLRSFGEGEPVVILHGLFGLSDNWVTFGKRLSINYKVFVPDLRNHGHSPHSGVFNFPSLVEDVYELIEDQGLDQVILIGHSLGGKTAMEFAFHYPEKIKKLIVVDISMRKYSGDSDHQMLIDAMLQVDFSVCTSRTDVEKQLAVTVKSLKLRQFLLKNVYWRDKSSMDWRINLNAINENLPLIFSSIGGDEVFKKPTLFIRGEHSDYIMDDDIRELYEHFPNASVKTISGASHWVHADAPEEFYQTVVEFIG